MIKFQFQKIKYDCININNFYAANNKDNNIKAANIDEFDFENIEEISYENI